jgi:hypothetical protein
MAHTDGPTDSQFVAHAALRVELDRGTSARGASPRTSRPLMRRPDGLP